MATHRARTEIIHRTCPLCEAKCGISVEVDREAGTVATIRGDVDDPFSRGYLCPKAYGLKGLQEDPDRLRRPIRRVGSDWREIGWEEAFEFAATRLREVRTAHGNDAIGTYVGNPNVHDLGATLYLAPLLRGLGTRRRFSASSVDQLPKMLSASLMFGAPLSIPIPDLDRTDFLLVLGANPIASNGSLMTAPDMPGRLAALRARGGKLVVIDPRRSGGRDRAREKLRSPWRPPRPLARIPSPGSAPLPRLARGIRGDPDSRVSPRTACEPMRKESRRRSRVG